MSSLKRQYDVCWTEDTEILSLSLSLSFALFYPFSPFPPISVSLIFCLVMVGMFWPEAVPGARLGEQTARARCGPNNSKITALIPREPTQATDENVYLSFWMKE